jgi:hypothetical protein
MAAARTLILFFLAFLFLRTSCNDDFMLFSTSNWSLAIMGNGGVSPVLTNADTLSKKVFGLRLTATTDALPNNDNKINWEVMNRLDSINIKTLTPYNGLGIGANVTNLFKMSFDQMKKSEHGGRTVYANFPLGVSMLNNPEFPIISDYYADLLLIEPPKGSQNVQFELRLFFADNIVETFETKTVFLR